MVRHQTPGEHLEAVLRRSRRQLLLQAGIVRAIERDQAAVVASRRHVVDLVRIEDAQLAAHAKTVERGPSRLRHDFPVVSDTRT